MSDSKKKKNPSGSIGIEVNNGKYRLRLPASMTGGCNSKRYISTRLPATPENLRRVERQIVIMEDDLDKGVFDGTLAKYSFKLPQLTLVQTLHPQVSLMDLWLGYCEFMKPQLAETTYIIQYESRYTNHVKNLKGFDFTTVEGVCSIRDHLLKSCTPYTTKRVLARLSAMTSWGMKSKRLTLTVNPFTEVIEELKVPKDKLDPDPFTLEERDIILETLKTHPVHSHYYNFIRFLFLTGCRTGEAIGLQWKHISKDCKVITFSDSLDSYLRVRKCTKTGTVRKFPCNSTLQELLLSMTRGKPDDLVFTTKEGKPINNTNFTTRVWRGYTTKSGKKYNGVLSQLVEDGYVSHYRCLYNTRHTFITMAVENGMTPNQVAKLVGNTPEVILNNYCGSTLKFEVPVI